MTSIVVGLIHKYQSMYQNKQSKPEAYAIYAFIMKRSGRYSYISPLINVLSKLFQKLIGTRPAEF